MPVALFSLAFALGGCAGTAPPRQYGPCASDPGGYDCQVENYMKAF